MLAWATALRVESTQLFDLRSALALCWAVLVSSVARALAAPRLRSLLRVLLQARLRGGIRLQRRLFRE